MTLDTTKAAAMRKKIKDTKVTVDWKDEPLSNVFTELKEMTGIAYRFDNKGGVSNNCCGLIAAPCTYPFVRRGSAR